MFRVDGEGWYTEGSHSSIGDSALLLAEIHRIALDGLNGTAAEAYIALSTIGMKTDPALNNADSATEAK